MNGIVIRSTGSWYSVKVTSPQPLSKGEGQSRSDTIECRIKGIFRLEEYNTTNPIAVGDHVKIELEGGQDTGMITEINDRKNCLLRQSPKNPGAVHIVAANIDQCIIVATITQPRTSTGFIDRIIVTAGAYDIPSVIVFNKVDAYNEKDLEKLENYVAIYKSAGYPIYTISALNEKDIETTRELVKGKVSLITGHSGVGKSTLINALIPDLDLRIKAISKSSGKGMHSTTFAEMFELPDEGFIIDTPGMKEFGILNIEPWEVAHFFPEMLPHIGKCQFNTCLHINETKCGVKDALEKGLIHIERYVNYCNIVEDLQSERVRKSAGGNIRR